MAQALKLANAGILKEESKGVFKFQDTFAKETLMRNYDKPLSVIAEANKGKSVEMPSQKQEIFERVKSISSEASFAKMLDKNGEIKPEALRDYAKTLEAVSIQLTEKANRVEITREDLKQASQSQTQERGRERA
jgi:histone H3/H4